VTRIVLVVAIFAVLELPFMLTGFGWGNFVSAAFINGSAAVLAVAAVCRWVERRPLATAGFGGYRVGRDVGYGALVGVALFAIVVAMLAATGSYRVTAVHLDRLPVAGGMVAVFIFAATFEEVIFRSVLFRLLEEWLGTWLALLLPAALFALSHALNNTGATAISTVSTFIAGMWLSAAYALTRQLWFPIAAHAAWNLSESMWGTTVSGDKLPHLIVTAHLSGPEWWQGGAYGPEAGLAVLVAITAATAVLIALTVRAGRLMAPSWRRASATISPVPA
jgi:membrane protease YdiL (CAAX protease family)